MELGGPEKTPIILTDHHVYFLSEHLPAQIEDLCSDAHYTCRDEDFRMNTAGSYRVASVYMGKRFIFFKLRELQHLSYLLYMVRNQLSGYTEAMTDVINHVTAALYYDKYVEPSVNASKAVLCYQLFEELKSIV